MMSGKDATMTNIFENTYFGKAYKTRDGRKAILQSIFQDKGTALLRTESKITANVFTSELRVNRLDGTSTFCPELDIVSEWQEHVDDEEKAREIAHNNCTHAHCSHGEDFFTSEGDCYKAAMEMAEWKEQQYQPLVDFILEYFEDDPSFICDYVSTEDNDWCFENCENFSKKCIDKWLDIKLKGGDK